MTTIRPGPRLSDSARRLVVASVAMLWWAPLVSGAQELAPGARYDPAIPEATIGQDPGDQTTTPEQMARYLDALATAAPDRLTVVE